jgi:molecular chaperone GrpE (heat shock protein)
MPSLFLEGNMLDFSKELDRLLSQETGADITDEAALWAEEGRRLLSSFSKQQTDLSLQVEEIYDLVNEAETERQALRAEQKNAGRLLGALIGLSDLIEDFYAFAERCQEESFAAQARAVWQSAGRVLSECEITRLGKEGQPFDTEIHTVESAAVSGFPREYAAKILRSGYRYKGSLLRKASIVISLGEGSQCPEE